MQGADRRIDLRRLEDAAAALRALPVRGALARESRAVWRAEVATSTALAGSRLRPHHVDALLDAGMARGEHPFDDYVLVRSYADAARWVADQRPHALGDPRPLLTVDELRQLHARVAGDSDRRGGAWRLGNPVPRAGIVAPGAWLVPREVTALVDRAARGPQHVPVALWLARFIGRLARIAPFESANGRVARLAANVMLRRLDIPPIVLERPERRRYPAAVAAAEADDPTPLAALIADAVVRACNRIRGAAAGDEAPAPLRALAGAQYAALAKAAQRGRLRTLLRGGRYYTTSAWIAEYAAATRSRGRAARARPA